jgi:hypothetical protein
MEFLAVILLGIPDRLGHHRLPGERAHAPVAQEDIEDLLMLPLFDILHDV